MNEHSHSPPKRKLFRTCLKGLAAAVVVVIFLLCGLIALLPTLASTDAFKAYAEDASALIFTRKIRIDKIDWSWSDGLFITNASVPDDPAFADTPLCHIRQLSIRPHIRGIFNRRVGVDLTIDGIRMNYIRDRNGRVNLEALFPTKEADETVKKAPVPEPPTVPEKGDIRFSIPVDIHAAIHLDRIHVLLDDRQNRKRIDVDNGSIHLDLPSLYQRPVRLAAAADVRIDANDSIACRLDVQATKTGENPSEIRPEHLLVKVRGRIPGIEFSADGDLEKEGLESRVNIELEELMAVAQPFLPGNLRDLSMTGKITLELAAERTSDNNVLFDTDLEASTIYASGQIVKARQIGPLDLEVENKGLFDVDNGVCEIRHGRIRLLKSSHLDWRARVSGLASARPKAEASIDRAFFNVRDMYKAVKVFLPPEFPFELHESPEKLPPNISIEGVRYTGAAGAGKKRVVLKRMALKLPGFSVRQEKQTLSVHDLVFTIEDTDADVTDIFPLEARAKVGLAAGRIQVPGMVNATDVRQLLDVACRLENPGQGDIAVNEFYVRIPAVSVDHALTGFLDTDVQLDVRPSRIVLTGSDPSRIDADVGGVSLRVGDMLKIDMDVRVKDTAETGLETKGDLHIDLAKIPGALFGAYKERVDISGGVRLAWRFAGRLPDADEKELLSSVPGRRTKDALAFIDHAEVRCSIDDMAARIGLGGEGHVTVGSASAEPLIGYTYVNATDTGKIDGNLSLGDITLMPDHGIEKPMTVRVSVNGEHNGLQRVRFSQDMTMEPFTVDQSVQMTLFGLDRILEEKRLTEPEAWLTKAGGQITALFRVNDMSGISLLKKDVDCTGTMETGITIDLLPRKMTGARVWATITDTDLALGDVFSVNDFRGALNMEKTYRIVPLDEADRRGFGSEAPKLSSTVMVMAYRNLTDATTPAEGNPPLYAADMTRFNPRRTVAFSSARVKQGPVPVHITTFNADITMEEGLPGIKRFQYDIFGGTVSGTVQPQRKGERFFIELIIYFTGIDFETILTGNRSETDTDDSEISGFVKLYLPITDSIDVLLEKVESDVMFTHIGPRALERLLYAIDPYESNEVIVSQRHLLSKGSPKWTELKIKDGSLSMRGELSIEGLDVEIPRLERLNIANLPGVDKYGTHLSGLTHVIKVLTIASSNALVVGDGQLEFNRME